MVIMNNYTEMAGLKRNQSRSGNAKIDAIVQKEILNGKRCMESLMILCECHGYHE